MKNKREREKKRRRRKRWRERDLKQQIGVEKIEKCDDQVVFNPAVCKSIIPHFFFLTRLDGD